MSGPEEHLRADAVRNRAALLEAAAEVLATAPDASLAEVATRARLGRATLYRHFESRDTLIAAIRAEALDRAATALAAADLTQCDTREGLRRAGAALVPLGLRFRILLAEGADTDPEFLAARDRTLAPLAALLERGRATGEIAPTASTPWLGLTLAGLLMTTVRAAAAGLVDPTDAGELVAATFLDGFGG
ncbi:TetR/AcrR family transcriptional regulator [Nocardioides sp.]|uniref:TetR/AcrR family transcriptional regulator n=1 Tax=Nocardioides sp. TaxID=35761 RepID=UPI002ED909E2